MMVVQQIAPGADCLSVLRLYFGQTNQHIADVGLTVGHITATQTALPKNVPIDHSFKYVPNECVPNECNGMAPPWQLKAVMQEPFRRSLMKGTGL